MNHHHYVRPLLREHLGHGRRYRSSAKLIPLHPHDVGAWQVAGLWSLTVATAIILVAMFVVALHSGKDLLNDLAPGWPWW
jgi:hypothetical protein